MRNIKHILTCALALSVACGFIWDHPAIAQETTEDPIAAPDNEELQRLIETAVSQRIRPLQREIADLKEEIRFHDILGGIGYIVGTAGIVFYFLGVRKRDGQKTGTNKTE